jgi:hypothetical protein
MSCESFRSVLIETARGAAPAPGFGEHLGQCGECRQRLNLQIELTAAMAREASETAAPCAPADLERSLLSEFDRVMAPRVLPGSRRVASTGAIAAGVVGVALISSWLARDQRRIEMAPPPAKSQAAALPLAEAVPAVVKTALAVRTTRRPTQQSPGTAVPDQSSDELNEEQSFVPVPYTVALAPGEPADLMRVEMPVAALIAAGMPVGAADPAARARADVIVGQDGQARAFRVISVSTFSSGGSIGHE